MLRKRTNSEIKSYSKRDQYPKHPNHGRDFHSRNLVCSEAHRTCGRCGAACCASHGASLTAISDPSSLEQKVAARLLLKDIRRWTTIGTDEGTFLQCTECQKFVCPSCISICPILQCNDQLCHSCKSENYIWKPCEHHSQNDIEWSENRRRELEDTGLF